jgi:hypothetical protein
VKCEFDALLREHFNLFKHIAILYSSRFRFLSEKGVLQVHISLAGDKHMRVSWITDDKYAPSIVEYGTLQVCTLSCLAPMQSMMSTQTNIAG